MKIAFLIFSFIPKMGGTQIFTYNIIKHLTMTNNEIDLYLPYRAKIEFEKLGLKNNFNIKAIFYSEYMILKYLPFLLNIILLYKQKRYKYDIWQIIGAYPAGWVAKNLLGKVPVILRAHGDDIQKNEKINYGVALDTKVDQRINRVLPKFSHLVALSNSVKDSYLEYGVNSKSISIIPNGINVNNYKEKIDKSIIRNKYKLDDNEHLILSVGRYHLKKGYQMIPKVSKLLLLNGLQFKWLIIGKGVGALESQIERNKINNIILEDGIGLDTDNSDEFDLPSKKLIEIYKSSDIFVMPSLLETFGMVLIEAMAAGLPIIASDAPGCRDVVKNGINGILFESENSDSLAQKIIQLINNNSLKNKLINNNLKHSEKYHWIKVAEMYNKIYKDFIIH